MKTKALILAGGLGTRLRPLTYHTPKCLVEVAGRPLLDRWVDALNSAGISQALINTHHLQDQVRAHIKTVNARGSVQLTETYEPELLGSAGTVSANRVWGDDADQIVVIYADNLSDIDLVALIAFHEVHLAPTTMALFHTPFPEKCGIAKLDDTGRVTSFIEKPKSPLSNLANAGLYVFDNAAWNEIADMNAFDLGFDVIPGFVGRMFGYLHSGYHRDIGTPESLEIADRDMRSRSA